MASGFAACTLVGLLITKERQNLLVGAGPKWMSGFALWISITLPFLMVFNESIPIWERSMKIFLMAFVKLALVTPEHRLRIFIWMNVVAIGYFCVKGEFFTMLTGNNFRVWGPCGFIEGNNELALAAISTLPLMRFLQTQMRHRRAVHAATMSMLLTVAIAVETHSRGALVGLICVRSYFWIKSDKKFFSAILFVAIILLVPPLMPEHWWSRMETIKTYEQDDSALGRINAWWMAFNLADDRVFGGGSMVYYPWIFQMYSAEPDRVHAVHSIYFQVLGEHGWVGLILLLGIGVATWPSARDLIRMARHSPRHAWAGHLGAMVQVSRIGYGSSGALPLLSLACFDLPYNVMIMTALAHRIVRSQLEVTVDSQAGSRPMATPAQQTGSNRRPDRNVT